MIEIKDGKFEAKGMNIEVLAEYAFITGAIAAGLKKQGVRDAESKMRIAAEKGLTSYERMVKKQI